MSSRSSLVARLAVAIAAAMMLRSEEHTSELQSQFHLVCRLLLEKKKGDSKWAITYPRLSQGCWALSSCRTFRFSLRHTHRTSGQYASPCFSVIALMLLMFF